MGFSSLADMRLRIPDGGRSSPRNAKITGFGVHHQAGVDAQGQASNPSHVVSANYWVCNDGTIIPHIDEDRRAFTSGNKHYPAGAQADHRNVTVEVSNTPEGVRNRTWEISPAAMKSLIALIADVYERHGLGPIQRSAVMGVGVHRDWVPTECPGPYVMANLPHIINEANTINDGVTPVIRRSKSMATVYHLTDSKPRVWALAGDGQGEAAWIETNTLDLAVAWRKVHHGFEEGAQGAIPLSQGGWDELKVKYKSAF